MTAFHMLLHLGVVRMRERDSLQGGRLAMLEDIPYQLLGQTKRTRRLAEWRMEHLEDLIIPRKWMLKMKMEPNEQK